MAIFRPLVLVAALGAAALPAAPTELLIRAVDESGRPVQLTRADVYFDVWGGGDVTRLAHSGSGNSVRVELDRAAACTPEPALCANHPTFQARLLLEAEGLAPISSELFDWMVDPLGGPTPPVSIRFPRNGPLVLERGERRDVTLIFRKTQPRSLHLVDPAGAPVPGVRVSLRNVFAASNHMGVFEGDVLIGDSATDPQGRIAIPDGDIEYGIEVHKKHWSLARPAFFSNTLATRINGPVVTLVMRPHARRPLQLAFVRNGNPAAKLDVQACVAVCSGACCGPIGTTDARGRLLVQEFYPEEYERVLVPAPNDPYNRNPIWEMDPRKTAGRATIDLTR